MTAALASQLTRAAFMYHADLSGVYQLRTDGLMLDCGTGELLTMHSCIMTSHGHIPLKHYAALKGLSVRPPPAGGTQEERAD